MIAHDACVPCPSEILDIALRYSRKWALRFKLDPNEFYACAWQAAEKEYASSKLTGENLINVIIYRVRYAIIDELRQIRPVSRRAAKKGVRVVFVDDLSHAQHERMFSVDGVEAAILDKKQVRDLLALAEQVLTEREFSVLTRASVHGEKHRDLAKELGISQPRISQLLRFAREKLVLAATASPEELRALRRQARLRARTAIANQWLRRKRSPSP